MTKEERDIMINVMAKELDTRDKRYMFLRLEFKDELPYINLDGTPHDTAWNIFERFRKNGMIGSLMACLNSKLDSDLCITYNSEEA